MEHQSSGNLKDPVCGMKVSNDSDFQTTFHDHTYYFCSEHCYDKFKAEPDSFLKEASSSGKNTDKHSHKDHACCHGEHSDHTCCHGDHAAHSHPSQQAVAANVPADAMYTCPMHPEIRQKGQGFCPKCGMALELEAVPVLNTKTQYTCPMHPEII